MKKENLPQDKTGLENFTREVCYVKDSKGKYSQELSTGWDVKANALDEAWVEIDRRVEEAAEKVRNQEASPILFFMELNLMDLPTLSSYISSFPFFVKRHLKYKVFKKLSEKKLSKYAEAFRISVDELKQFDGTNIDGYKNQ